MNYTSQMKIKQLKLHEDKKIDIFLMCLFCLVIFVVCLVGGFWEGFGFCFGLGFLLQLFVCGGFFSSFGYQSLTSFLSV